jgi:hypothetical protein
MDGQDGVARVVRVEEQGPQLGLLEVLLEPADGRFDIALDAFTLGGELRQDLDLLLLGENALEEQEVLFEELFLLLEALGGLLVLPNLGRGQAGVYGLEARGLGTEVKENLGPLRPWRRDRSSGS